MLQAIDARLHIDPDETHAMSQPCKHSRMGKRQSQSWYFIEELPVVRRQVLGRRKMGRIDGEDGDTDSAFDRKSIVCY